MTQDLKPFLLVSPLKIEAEFSTVCERDEIKCNNSGTVSCGNPGVLDD